MAIYKSSKKFLGYEVKCFGDEFHPYAGKVEGDPFGKHFKVKATKEGLHVFVRDRLFPQIFGSVEANPEQNFFVARNSYGDIVFNKNNGAVIDAISRPKDDFLISKTCDIYTVENGNISNLPFTQKAFVTADNHVVFTDSFETNHVLTIDRDGYVNVVDNAGRVTLPRISKDGKASVQMIYTTDDSRKVYFILKDNKCSSIFTPTEMIYKTKDPSEEIIFKNYDLMQNNFETICNPELRYVIAIYNKSQDVTHSELHAKDGKILFFSTPGKLQDIICEEDYHLTILADDGKGHKKAYMFGIDDSRVSFVKPKTLQDKTVAKSRVAKPNINPNKPNFGGYSM